MLWRILMRKIDREKKMINDLFTSQEKYVLSLIFREEIGEEDIAIIVEDLNLDNQDRNFLLLLSRIGFLVNWKYFPPEVVPTLQGIHRYAQALCSVKNAWFLEKMKVLSQKNVSVLILLNSALKLFYIPEYPRYIWNFEIFLPEAERSSLFLLQDEKNSYVKASSHTEAIVGESEIDSHHWVFKLFLEKNVDIWSRVVPITVRNVNFFVMNKVDMIIHLFDTYTHEYFTKGKHCKLLMAMLDVKTILEEDKTITLEKIAQCSCEFHNTNRIHFALSSFLDCFPDTFSKEEFDSYFPNSRDYRKWLKNAQRYQKMVLQYVDYKYPEQSAITPLRVFRAFKKEWITYQYLKSEIQSTEANLTFWRYCKKIKGVRSFSEMVKKYAKKIRIKSKN